MTLKGYIGIYAAAIAAMLPSALPALATDWATPRISVACIRTEPAHAAELSSQAVMGTPMQVLEHRGEWYKVETPEGYQGWMTAPSLVTRTDAEMAQWRADDNRLVVTAVYQVRAYNGPHTYGFKDVVTDLVNACIITATGRSEGVRVEVALPDGRKGWVDASAVTPIRLWAAQDFNAEKILDMAYSMEGQPYLWGGTSTKSLDCSGLSKVSYLSCAIILKRDASQQARTGLRIEASDWRSCQAGDLLFFGNADTGKVTHVAIYDANGNYVHSSGRVKRNSVDPASPAYLTTPFLHAVRIHGYEGTDVITQVRNHPWYF